MLVLTRRLGESIVIADDIQVRVISIRGDRVRIGIAAPEDVRIDRLEIHERRHRAVEAEYEVHAAVDSDVGSLWRTKG